MSRHVDERLRATMRARVQTLTALIEEMREELEGVEAALELLDQHIEVSWAKAEGEEG